MKFEDLSPADQALLNTDFGELDKVAEEMVKEAGECYERGFEKTALEIADGIDKAAEDEKKEEKEEPKHDEEGEKKAAQLGAFYERGVFDGLSKLGQARHGDPMHYFWPFVEEKIAEKGAAGAVAKFMDRMKGHGSSAVAKAKDVAGKAGEAVKDYHKAGVKDIKSGVTGKTFFKGRQGGTVTHGAEDRAKKLGKGLARFTPHAAAAGAAGAAIHHAASKKD